MAMMISRQALNCELPVRRWEFVPLRGMLHRRALDGLARFCDQYAQVRARARRFSMRVYGEIRTRQQTIEVTY
jgi:hypothetical protein